MEPHAIWPAWQVRQSFPAALQPSPHIVWLVEQAPVELQTAALVLILVLLEQDAPAPQGVLTSMLPVSLHTITPVVQEVVPVLQGFVGVHAWLGVQAPQVPVRQKRLVPHIMPSGARLHAPEPLQVVWQLAVVQPGSVAPLALAEQVPGVARLQAWQVPQLAVVQQTPSTQLPEAHSPPPPQLRPGGLAAWQLPALQ
jgi:hypothetical protein